MGLNQATSDRGRVLLSFPKDWDELMVAEREEAALRMADRLIQQLGAPGVTA